MLNNSLIELIFTRLQSVTPEPAIELTYTSPYTLLVAVMLSAQATDKMVNKITPALFSAANTPDAMVKLGPNKLREYIKSINYFNNKADNIIKTSKILVDEYNGEVPDSFEELTKLPGIGRKSANVILNSVYGHPTIAVDTHVFRVSNRLGLCKTTTPEATEKELMKIVPNIFKQDAHHLLVLHGRYICKAKKPNCSECVLADLCISNNKT